MLLHVKALLPTCLSHYRQRFTLLNLSWSRGSLQFERLIAGIFPAKHIYPPLFKQARQVKHRLLTHGGNPHELSHLQIIVNSHAAMEEG
jgi:hypothetical protein